MRALNTTETYLSIAASILIILVVHQTLLGHHRELKNTVHELRARNATLIKRYVTAPEPQQDAFRSHDELLDGMIDSLIPFDRLSVTQQNNTIVFEFNGSTMQVWNMMRLLSTIADVLPGKFEFRLANTVVTGHLELHLLSP